MSAPMGPWQTDDTTLPFFHAELIRSCSFLLLGKSTASKQAKFGASIELTNLGTRSKLCPLDTKQQDR